MISLLKAARVAELKGASTLNWHSQVTANGEGTVRGYHNGIANNLRNHGGMECAGSYRIFRRSAGWDSSAFAPPARSSSALRNPHSAPTGNMPAPAAVFMSVPVSPR